MSTDIQTAPITQFIDFLAASPTPFHAVENLSNRLQGAGYAPLDDTTQWELQPGGRYLLTRNGSSLVAFVYGRHSPVDSGIRLLGAHTDSPCLKIKPEPELDKHGYRRLGVEVYGGALLNPWFDRDLSIAGRLSVLIKQQIRNVLFNYVDPVAVVPSLAIHLDREQNASKSVNAQNHLPAILGVTQSEAPDFRSMLLERVRQEPPTAAAEKVLDFDLHLYDVQQPQRVGLGGAFIAGARLDNLLSCFAGALALESCSGDISALLICNDHEEVGSQSAVGAQGPMLSSFLERVFPQVCERERILARSMLISVDNAHGIHPNFVDRHDERHGPIINSGPVIKLNANQRYASNSETAAIFRYLCEREDIPVQSFVMRSDLACGSTIGPITAAELGVRTLDIGVPTFAMHSIRELAGVQDFTYLLRALCRFVALGRLPL